MHIAIVGPGRLGRTLAVLLDKRGHTVTICMRGDLPPSADGCLLTVPDQSITEVSNWLPPQSGPLLHCSGVTEFSVLKPHFPAGSFHPLMTFPGPEIMIPETEGVPCAIAGDPTAVHFARKLAEALGMNPFEVPGDRRLYHASAVIAGNFATVLLAEAATLLEKAGVPKENALSILVPLATQSLYNAVPDPASALTGPVARGDEIVLTAHREALAEHAPQEILDLYNLFVTRAKRLISPS